MKKTLYKLTAILLLLALCSCGSNITGSTGAVSGNEPSSEDSKSPTESTVKDTHSGDETEGDSRFEYEPDEYFSRFDLTITTENAQTIDLSTPSGYPSSVTYKDGKTIISLAGEYLIRGAVTDGTLIVDVPKTDKVHLIFDGVSISSSSSAAVWVKSADKVAITLKAGSENHLTDGSYDPDALGAPKGALYSEDDLTINGSGKLTVMGNSNNAISAKNDLAIIGAVIEASAVKNALKGNDSVRIKAADIKLTAGKDGIKSDTVNKPEKGFVYICDSNITIEARDDGIQAELYVRIPSGNIVCYAADLAVCCEKEITVADCCLSERSYNDRGKHNS